ncbi:hypothetical protein OPV22_022850 [Ensete ventricosum]|uniref:Uncharacterized protein n=1 Tax=Ensete ventricosum TaxID=4639 RepID=A0AAV8QQR3_ENSVE|nr:hypothetical protein OPV22_022850 [Ensete ventricosum]
MTGDGSHRSTRRLLLLLLSIALHLIPGLSENPSPSKDSTKADSHSSSRSNTGLKVLLICLGAIALVLFRAWTSGLRNFRDGLYLVRGKDKVGGCHE